MPDYSEIPSGLLKQIMERVRKEPGGHWLWEGDHHPKGYAWATQEQEGRRRTFLVHRVLYEAYRRPVPDGHQLENDCGIPGCVNPDHWLMEEGNPGTKARERSSPLTWPIVRELRRRRTERGSTYPELSEWLYRAHDIDMDPSGIGKVCRGQRWPPERDPLLQEAPE